MLFDPNKMNALNWPIYIFYNKYYKNLFTVKILINTVCILWLSYLYNTTFNSFYKIQQCKTLK